MSTSSNEFPTIPLSQTTKFIVDNRGKTAPTAEIGIPLIATNCIDNRQLYPTFDNIRYVSEETYQNWFRSHPEPNDIILTLKGSQNGAACLAPDPVGFAIAQDMVALRVDEKKFDYAFLLATLRSPDVQSEIKNLDVSGVIPHLKKSDFDKLHIPNPPIAIQKAIGKVYLDFCRKIDLLHRQNKTLEAMAETLFRQWFVEEANDDWDEVRLDEVADLNLSTVTNSYSQEHILYLDTSSLTEGVFGNMQLLSRDDAPSRAKRLVQHNDVLISTVRPDQRHYGIVKAPAANLVVSTGFCVISASKIDPHYLYVLLTGDDMTEFLHSIAEGSTSTYPSLKPSDLAVITFKKPPQARHDEFAETANKNWNKITCNSTQISTLEKLRDTLLPKLMSGEVRAI